MLTNRATFHKARKIGKASDRILRLRWTDNTYDDYRTVLFVEGWDYSRFSKNSPFQYCHDWFAPPLGDVVDCQIEVEIQRALRSGGTVKDTALDCDVRFSKSKNHEFSHLIYDLYIEGIMRATSCGFFPIETKKATEEDGERFNIPAEDVESGKAEVWWRNKLFEISAVPLPGNENAVKGLEKAMTRRGSGFARKVGTTWLSEHFHKSRTSGLILPEYFGGTLTQILRRLSGDKKRRDWRQMESQVQSVIFSKEFWDADRARTWLSEHDLKSEKMDETEETLRFRQFDPTQCVEGTGITLTEDMPEGVSMFACEVAAEGACPTEARIDAKRLLELDPHLLTGIAMRRMKNVRTSFRQGGTLATLLNNLIDGQVTEERSREQIIEEIATEAGIESAMVDQILNGEIGCPPVERFEAFAKVLGASVESMISAGNADGCTYNGGDNVEIVEDVEPGTTTARGRRHRPYVSKRLFDEQIQKLRVIQKAIGEVADFFTDKLGKEDEPEVEPTLDENGDVIDEGGGSGQDDNNKAMKKYINNKFGELKRLLQQNGGGRGASQRHTSHSYLDGLTLDNMGGERDLESALSRIEDNLE